VRRSRANSGEAVLGLEEDADSRGQETGGVRGQANAQVHEASRRNFPGHAPRDDLFVIRVAPSGIMATAVSNEIAVFIAVSVSRSDRRDVSENPAIVPAARDRCPYPLDSD
jgi:hypothetical protein